MNTAALIIVNERGRFLRR